MNTYKVNAINLHMGQGEINVTKIIKAGNIESVLDIYYAKYLTIEIISITKIEDNQNWNELDDCHNC